MRFIHPRHRSIPVGPTGCVGSVTSVFLNSDLRTYLFLIDDLYYTLYALYNQFNHTNVFIKEIYIMELEKKYIYQVYVNGSFSKAAEALFVTSRL